MPADESKGLSLPKDFYKIVRLPVGIMFGGELQREVRVGPETAAARHRALARREDWIDTDLAELVLLYDYHDRVVETWKKERGPAPKKPTLSEEQLSLGRRSWAAWYECLAVERVVRLGAIPADRVLDAARQLVRADVRELASACEEVDVVVNKFRESNEKGDSDGNQGDGGGTSGGGDLTELL